MTEKRLKILYDASILVDGEFDNGCRSGVYFAALNILNELCKREYLDITLFSELSKGAGLNNVIESKFPLQKSIYKNGLVSQRIFLLLAFLREKRTHFFQHTLIRKFLSLIEISVISCYDCFFYVKCFFCKSNLFDVYFSPFSAAPWYIRSQKKIKKYIILYDIIPFKIEEYSNQKQIGWFGRLMRHLNSFDGYFAISQATKDDFSRICPHLEPSKINVVYLAANEKYCHQKNNISANFVKKKYNLPQDKRYIFSLCTLEPRKNLIRAVRTFVEFVEKNKINDLIFILGGRAWKMFPEKIKAEFSDPSVFSKYVLMVGYVDDDDLPILYSNAEWFVYTSQYEGFGLPPLEAMRCGCPVITSNNSSLPEVVGDAGIMIDWDSDEQHVSAYEKYYFDEQIRKKNSAKGLVRASLFSWSNTVDKMLRVMKQGGRV